LKEENIMRQLKQSWGVVVLFAVGVWLLGSVPHAGAQTTVKGRHVSHRTRVEVIKVGDVEGHIIGMFERRGLTFYEDGEVATYVSRGTFDALKGRSTHQGYSIDTFEDGSTIVHTWHGEGTTAPGGKTSTSKGTIDKVGGSGRFAEVKGSGSYTCKRLVPGSAGGDSYCDFTETRTMPSG
jgi:hypothetical protein